MEFLTLAQARRSIRAFEDRPVPADLTAKLLEAAQASPSAGNRQPWHFYVISDKAVIGDIHAAPCPQPLLTTAPLLIVVCTEAARCAEKYGERGETLYCIQDTAAAIQNILLCAQDLGLGACWCGAFYEDKLAELLAMPAGRRPIAILPVGYPAVSPKPTPRRPIEEITTFIG